MEINSENVAEIQKYAFLLGSAIKNEDTEQFFSIYDSILPKDLPVSQLQEIKDKARLVSELPDGEFNNLVLKARTFSLAPSGSVMSCRESNKKWGEPVQGEASDEEDDGIASLGFSRLPSGGRSDTSSLYSTAKVSTQGSESEARRFDDDSGVCNSSKATNSCGSFSDGSDDEGRGGMFDYYPPQVKIRSGCGMNLDYDEAHEVKSDHSSQDVNSPRSDISEGTEMTTFHSGRRINEDTDDDFNFTRDSANYQDDFNTDGDSDEDSFRYRRFYKMGFRPLDKDPANFKPHFTSSRDSELSMSGLRNNEVDKGIKFGGLNNQYSRHCTASSGVKIEKNSYGKDPPFGHGPEQLHKVGSSINQLIADIPSDKVKNMPEGRKLELLQPEESRRKKKKKKLSKDDASTDENGNPIVEKLGLKSAAYKQMRESPASGAGGSVPNSHNSFDTTSYKASPFHGSVEQLSSNRFSATSPRDDVNDPANKRRRKRKTDKQDVKKSEDIDDYKGNKLSIEELVNFIGGQNVSNKKTKKQATPTSSEDIPGPKTQKSNKKNKDKKQKSPPSSGTSPVEAAPGEPSSVKESHSAQFLALVTQELNTDTMGNSSVKSSTDTVIDIPVENGDIVDGLYSNREKLALLKDNNKTTIEVCKQTDLQTLTHDDDGKCAPDSFNDMINCKKIYKEKESTGTNNKRDAVSASVIIPENNKKKSEKSPSVKTASKVERIVEKAEMPPSKSEDLFKVNATIANNITVKQKNAKNKKSKPASPTMKADSESCVVDAVTVHQQVLADFPDIVDNNFIFTDLDVPQVPKEDEFQVVGKKKKKVTKELSPAHPNNFLSSGGNSGKSSRRFEDKRGGNHSVTHSNSKTSVQVTPQISPVENDKHLRDLSPSAFPALGSGKGRQQERRNSTGDVPIPSGLKSSQDDSDLESVKSLPATQGSQVNDVALSPRLSYARMAAHLAPSKPSDALDVEHDPGLEMGSGEIDPKKAVWKGSPTERRHSIGSSPEVVNKNTGGSCAPSAAVSTKAGSQEHIIADAALKAESSLAAGVRNVNVWGSRSPGSEVIAIKLDSDYESVLHREISPSETSKASSRVSIPPVLSSEPTGLTFMSPVKVAPGELDSANSVSTRSQQATAATSARATVATDKPTELVNNHESVIQNSISSNSRNSVINSSVHKQDSSKLGTTTKSSNGSNGKKQKSVIFLDKRVEEAPGNLDISFGFEIDSLDKPVSMDHQSAATRRSAEPCVVDKLEFCSDLTPVHNDTSSVIIQDSYSNSDGKDVNSIHVNSPSFSSSTTSVISNNADISQESSKSSLVSDAGSESGAKITAPAPRLNGVVDRIQAQAPNLRKANSNTVKPIKDDVPVSNVSVASPGTEVSDAASHGAAAASHVHAAGRDGEFVYYGECVEALKKDVLVPSLTNGPTRYCGLVGFIQQMEIPSNFDITEAASFLTREWDRTVKLQTNEPDKVSVHGE